MRIRWWTGTGDTHRQMLTSSPFLTFQHVTNVGNHGFNLGDDLATNIGNGSMRISPWRRLWHISL